LLAYKSGVKIKKKIKLGFLSIQKLNKFFLQEKEKKSEFRLIMLNKGLMLNLIPLLILKLAKVPFK